MKNFWKMATIGLAGYVLGREHRTYTGPVRYNYGISQDHPRSFVSTFAKVLGENIGKRIIGRKDSECPSNVATRAHYPEFRTKDDAHSIIDWLEEECSMYGIVNVSDYLNYLKDHYYLLANTDYTKHTFDLTSHYTDNCYGWTYPFEASPILLPNGNWKIAFPPIQCLKKKKEVI